MTGVREVLRLEYTNSFNFESIWTTSKKMTSDSRKLVNLIQDKGKFSFSFEVTPDVKNEDIESLEVTPTFFAVTWHAKSHQCKDLDIAPLKTASFLRSNQKQVLMHLSCDLLTKHYLERVLAFLQEKEICNLFLVLGGEYSLRFLWFCDVVMF